MMSNALGPPLKKKEQKMPHLLGIDITADAATTATEDVPKAYASGPILGILQMKIQEAARLERKI